MPNRIIKESICTSYDIESLSMFAEVTFYRLLTFADDFGRFQADPNVILGGIYPLRLQEISIEEFETCLNELAENRLILFYAGSNGKPYGVFPSWDNHQNRRAKHSKHPDPPEHEEDYFTSLESLMDACEGNRKSMKSHASICKHIPTYVAEESRNRGVEESRKDMNANDNNSDHADEGSNNGYNNNPDKPKLEDVIEEGNMRGITKQECEIYYDMRDRHNWLMWNKGSESWIPIQNWRSDLRFLKSKGALRPDQNVTENTAPKKSKIETS